MNRLDEIKERYSSKGEIKAVQIADDLGLLVLAVQQLGAERAAYQELFEAVDDDYKSLIETHPEIYEAYNNMSATKEPDPDVLELIGATDDAD